MQEDAERRVLVALALAKKGDERARTEVTEFVFRRWEGRIARFYHSDPAFDQQDIQAEYYLGIWDHVPKADGRGSDLYHLSQRGVWRVQSTIRAARRMRHGAEHDGMSMVPLGEVHAAYEVPDPNDDFEIIIQHDYSRSRWVTMCAGATDQLRGTSKAVLQALMEGVDSPDESGFTNRMADRLGVSPQRVSQCMNQVRAELARHDPEGLHE